MSVKKIPDSAIRLKLIGDEKVGKSLIVHILTSNPVSKTYQPTVGVDVHLISESDYSILILDTSGNKSIKSLASQYAENINIIWYVYSLSDADSYNNLDHWIKQERSYLKKKDEKTFEYIVGVGIKEDSMNLTGNEEIKEEPIINENHNKLYGNSGITVKIVASYSSITQMLYELCHDVENDRKEIERLRQLKNNPPPIPPVIVQPVKPSAPPQPYIPIPVIHSIDSNDSKPVYRPVEVAKKSTCCILL
jgi:GTPase SAR1 family protein